MASTFRCIKLHVVFGTRNRVPLITSEIRPRLHAYLGGIARDLGAKPLTVGGVADHVHMLLDMPTDIAVADAIRDVKANSTNWIHDQFTSARSFHWQTGYGVFSVSPANVPRVIRYIERQEEHHRKVSFADEMRRFLSDAGLEFDERWLVG